MNTPPKKIFKFLGRGILEDRSPVINAVNTLVDFIKPTLGPKIKHILVDMGYKSELMDDGVSIVKEFELDDEFENAVIQYVKEIAQKTDDKAGDGTTTTMILLGGLLEKLIASGKSYPEIANELDKAKDEAIAYLDKETVEIKTEEDLYKVAKTSMNDEEFARKIANIIFNAGKDSAVTVTDYTGRGIESERLEGFVLPRGVINRGMITDKAKEKSILPSIFPDQPLIVVSDKVLSTQEDILPILEAAQKMNRKNIFIFCSNLIGEALLGVAQANIRGIFFISAAQLPGQGEKIKDFLDDICVVTGASLPGEKFNEVNFGSAERIESSFEDTAIIGGKGSSEDIENRIAYLKQKSEETKELYDKEYFFKRQARIQGGIVLIKVGGITDTEAKLRLKKTEDAVNSAKCALEAGIVPGGGISLIKANTSSEALNFAVAGVFKTLLDNGVIKNVKIEDIGEKQTINVLTGQIGDYLEIGVVDAVKVIKTALENAISLAKILFSLAGIITNEHNKTNNN